MSVSRRTWSLLLAAAACRVDPAAVEGKSCSPEKPCPGALSCVDEQCRSCAGRICAPRGEACSTGDECASGFCAQGVCCNVACEGACEDCHLASSLGVCVIVPAGATGSASCAPYVCDGASAACPSSCQASGQCAPEHGCSQGQCLAKLHTFRDDFERTVLGSGWTIWFSPSGGDVSLQGGRLQLTTALSTANAFGVKAEARFDARDSAFTVEILDPGNQALDSLELYVIDLSATVDDSVFMLVADTTLVAYKQAGGVNTPLASVAYSASTRVVRIREAAGRTYFEYAPQAAGPFTTLHEMDDTIPMDEVQVDMYAGTWAPETTSTTILLDNVNVP